MPKVLPGKVRMDNLLACEWKDDSGIVGWTVYDESRKQGDLIPIVGILRLVRGSARIIYAVPEFGFSCSKVCEAIRTYYAASRRGG